jgi:hypothetical protein
MLHRPRTRRPVSVRTSPRWRGPVVIGAALAMPLALAVCTDMSERATDVLAVLGSVALLAGGVAWETAAGLAARRRGVGTTRPVLVAGASYFLGASIVRSVAWLVALQRSTLRGVGVSPSVYVAGLASLWVAAAISAGVVVLVVGASAHLQRPPDPG